MRSVGVVLLWVSAGQPDGVKTSHEPWLLKSQDPIWAVPLPEGIHSKRDDGGSVHVALASDESQWPGLVASMRSVSAHAEAPERLHIHVIVPVGLSSVAAQRLGGCAGAPAARLPQLSLVPFDGEWLRPMIRVKAKAREVGNLTSLLNYARFYLHRLLPTVRRVVWLDVDTITLCDLPTILASLGDEFIAAAVPWIERYREVYRGRAQRAFKARYGFHIAGSVRTFNAGVLVLNLAAWEAHNLTAEVEWWLWAHSKAPEPLWTYGTQPLLHMVLYKRWRRLRQIWNVANMGWRERLAPEEEARLDKACVLHWYVRRAAMRAHGPGSGAAPHAHSATAPAVLLSAPQERSTQAVARRRTPS